MDLARDLFFHQCENGTFQAQGLIDLVSMKMMWLIYYVLHTLNPVELLSKILDWCVKQRCPPPTSNHQKGKIFWKGAAHLPRGEICEQWVWNVSIIVVSAHVDIWVDILINRNVRNVDNGWMYTYCSF